MRKKIIGCIVVLTLGALVSGGCAKKDVVRSEEPAAQVTTDQTPPVETKKAEEPAPVAQAEPAAPAKAEAVVETPVVQPVVKPEIKEGMDVPALQAALKTIYFDFDSAALSDASRGALGKYFELLGKQAGVKVRIEGNCDERGSDEYNMALGERRAKAAKDYLVSLGLPGDRLTTISYGEEKPVVEGHNEAAWSKNRRDDFVIVK